MSACLSGAFPAWCCLFRKLYLTMFIYQAWANSYSYTHSWINPFIWPHRCDHWYADKFQTNSKKTSLPLFYRFFQIFRIDFFLIIDFMKIKCNGWPQKWRYKGAAAYRYNKVLIATPTANTNLEIVNKNMCWWRRCVSQSM